MSPSPSPYFLILGCEGNRVIVVFGYSRDKFIFVAQLEFGGYVVKLFFLFLLEIRIILVSS